MPASPRTLPPLPRAPRHEPSGRAPRRREPHFGRVFAIVAGAHVVVLLVFSFWSWLVPKPKPAEVIAMFNPGDLVAGAPGAAGGGPSAAPAPAPKALPLSVPRLTLPPPASRPPPEPTPTSTPPPAVKTPAAEAPSQIPLAKTPPKPTPTPKPKPAPAPEANEAPASEAPPAKPKIKVNLKEVTRTSAGAVASNPPNARPDGADGGTGLSAADVRAKLGQGLQQAGIGTGTGFGKGAGGPAGSGGMGVGASGVPGGLGGQYADYFTLIRDQMYAAWDQPIALVGKGLQTQVAIVIEKDGRISSVALHRGSGNPEHDATALAAARRVGRIRRPLPDGLDGQVTVNFRLEK